MERRGGVGRVFIAVIVILAVGLAGLGVVLYQQTVIAPSSVSLQLDYSPGPSHAPYYYGVQEGIYKQNGINLTIIPGTTVSAGLAALEAGKVDFDISDPANLVLFMSNNNASNIRIVALLYQRNFAAVVYNEANISTPADLNDKAGAELNPATSAFGGVFSLFARANDLNTSSMNIQYVQASQTASLLLEGKVQFIVTTIQELPTVQALASPGQKFGAFDVADYGVQMAGFGIVTTEQIIQQNPGLVQKFVNATMHSFVATYANPTTAIADLVDKNPQLNQTVTMQGYQLITGCCMLNPGNLTNPLQFGWINPQFMQQTVDNAEASFNLKTSINATSIYTDQFVQEP